MKRAIQFAYAAGIVDGEGSLGVVYYADHNQYQARIQVVMTNPKPLEILRGLFGGSLCATKMAPNGRKQPYHYTASGKNLVRLLESVLPYLIEKKSQAENLLELTRNVEEWNAKGRQRGNLPAEVMEYRRALKQRSHELKDRALIEMPVDRRLDKRETLAYSAGILEAEGCFSILKGNGNAFFSVITVQMCCKPVVDSLQERFGGSTIERRSKAGTKIFMWRTKGQAAADVCRSITPYLAFRHEEAELLRNLQNTTNLWAKKVGRGGIPAHVTEKRIRWMNRIHEIHSPARAETKSEKPALLPVSDSPICSELLVAGPESLVAAA